jgi:hypothetical protein
MRIIAFGIAASLVTGTAVAQPVTVFVKRPAFINDLSKNTDEVVRSLNRGKKEVRVVTEESGAQLTVELLSVVKIATGVRNVDQLSSAIAGRVLYKSGDSYTATLKLCIPSKDHCEEIIANEKSDWYSAWSAADKVKKFAKENATQLR